MEAVNERTRDPGRSGFCRVIRVVVTGSECTGKTTLAAALAERFEAVCVPEYVRQYVLEKGEPPTVNDVDAIARGQLALERSLEDEAVQRESKLLILDTDLLSTIVYSRHYYGACPSSVEKAFEERQADLYFLAGIDVPWVPDGDQRDRGHRREEMQNLFRQALTSRDLRFVEIQGAVEERVAKATKAIDQLL